MPRYSRPGLGQLGDVPFMAHDLKERVRDTTVMRWSSRLALQLQARFHHVCVKIRYVPSGYKHASSTTPANAPAPS